MNFHKPFFFILLATYFSCEDQNQSVSENLEVDNSNYWNNRSLNLEDATNSELADYRPADSIQVAAVQNSKDDFKIDYGYSFGECFGFCEKTKTLSSAGILSISKRWKDGYIKTEYHQIKKSKYEELIDGINFKEFYDFNKNLGCGDCADGGNEWLKITFKNKTKQVGGTYGYKIEAVQELLAFFRAVKN